MKRETERERAMLFKILLCVMIEMIGMMRFSLLFRMFQSASMFPLNTSNIYTTVKSSQYSTQFFYPQQCDFSTMDSALKIEWNCTGRGKKKISKHF